MKHEMLVVAGRRGRGKSAFAVREAILTLKKGRTVWANFPLDLRHIKHKGKCFWADGLDDIADMRNGLFIVDEAHYLASGRWKQLNKDTHALISLSRHLEMRIIWISQNFRRLDPIIRELADGVIILKKFGRLSFGKHWLADDLNEEGKVKEKARSYDSTKFWHTKKIHRAYDDKGLIIELLADRKPRKWVVNGRGIELRPASDAHAPRSGAHAPEDEADTLARGEVVPCASKPLKKPLRVSWVARHWRRLTHFRRREKVSMARSHDPRAPQGRNP